MSGQSLTIRVDFDSDWGVGNGAGRHGSLDRVVVKDDLGLPMVPAKTITGILRDAAEQAAFGLDEAKTDDTWAGWVDWLFGSSPSQGNAAHDGQRREPGTGQPPFPAVLSTRPGYLVDLRAAVAKAPLSDPDLNAQGSAGAHPPAASAGRFPRRSSLTRAELAAAAVIVRPGVKVDRSTGVAADDTLRMEQYARAGQTVIAEAMTTQPLPEEAQLLLALAAKLATSIGGKRRRGLGACTVTIEGLTELPDQRKEELATQPNLSPNRKRSGGEAKSSEATPASTSNDAAASGPSPKLPAAGTMRRLGKIEVTCLTPVAVSSATVSNTVLTLDYIPGGNLLPIVADALGDTLASELIRAGRIVVTDAFLVRAGQRTLPMPRALQAPKRAPATEALYNALIPPEPRVMAVPGYLAQGGNPSDPVSVHRVDLVEAAHAVIDDATQRPTEATGGLFIQQAIPAGTVLRAELWADSDLVLELPERAAVGRAKKDDYGWVALAFTAEPATAGATQPTADAGKGALPCHCRDDGRLRVWLTSDALLTTEGRPDPSPTALAAAVGAAIGRELSVTSAGFVTWRRHETWAARWALPRPSLVGLAAGSVVELAGAKCEDGECPWSALEALAARGIGARRVEGFGRLQFNPRVLDPDRVSRRAPTDADAGSPATTATGSAETPAPGSADLDSSADLVTKQAWRNVIDARAMEYAVNAELRSRIIPEGATKAQLGALRGVVNALSADLTGSGPGRAVARAWVEPLTSTDKAKRNDSRAAKWECDYEERITTKDGKVRSEKLGIADWLGVKENQPRWPNRIAAALGIDVRVLQKQKLLGYARTALLLHCVTQASRELQKRERADPPKQQAPTTNAEVSA